MSKKPKSYLQAKEDSDWCRAMKEELDALKNNHTWYLTQLSKEKNPIASKWVFRTKYKPDESVDRYKPRLVAKSFSQLLGLHFHENFSLVAKLVTVKLYFAIATSFNWVIVMFVENQTIMHLNTRREWEEMTIILGTFMQNKSAFVSYTSLEEGKEMVYLVDSRTTQVLGKEVPFKLISGKTLTLNEVLYIPNIRTNMVSIGFLRNIAVKVSFKFDIVVLTKHNVFIGKGYYNNGLFML